MADYELNGQGQYINYLNGGGSDYTVDPATGYPKAVENSLGLFLMGGQGADGKSYPKVDMSLWDQATMCATCHVGGVFYEQDRMGTRLPARLFADWGAAMTGTGVPNINPITTTVWESYDATTGAPTSKPTFSPWVMPMFTGNDPVNGSPIIPTDSTGNPLNLGLSVPKDMQMPNPNYDPSNPAAGPQYFSLKKGQLLMPNVKEMDCLFCHMTGYNNVMASVMTQAGNLAYASTAGAMLMNTMTQSYDMPNAALGTPVPGMGVPVSLSSSAVANILAQPDSNNCMQCHATRTLKNLPEMFGTTGTSSGFLSSAPMVYDPAYGNGPLGKRMVSYDINAPFQMGGTTPVLTVSNYMNYFMPGLPFPQANGVTLYNSPMASGQIGGGNTQSGPLYYSSSAGSLDQSTMKRSTMPFPRAEWFKRGDAWQDGKDLHSSFGCAGCHYTGDSTHKNQCDPGRGFDMMSGIEDSVPPLKDRNLVTTGLGSFTNYSGLQTPAKHDTRNTVKRCEFCHITGKDNYGNAINTFGAPNPTTVHQNAGLLANVVQIVDNIDVHGTFGGQGVSDTTEFSRPGKTTLDVGNHLDVMDCTVCHVQKQTMMVRTLDATSGMRFPSVLGTDPSKGMMSLFEDPAPTAFKNYAAEQINGMYAAMGAPAPYTLNSNGVYVGADGAPAVGGTLQPSKPLHTWQKLGNSGAPLDISGVDPSPNPTGGLKWRRKIYLSNPIVAAIWNNTDPAVDANGDGAPGGDMTNAKASLAGYKDVFTGELLNKNNAQGYGDPIFDPWIMRDLKAGFNFGPAPLSVISVGFGSSPAYASAYDSTGAFTGAYKYVSVWSGAVILTEPDQIAAYKAFRTANNVSGDGKSWTGTELGLIGDPFTITHGVQSTSNYVLGKSCADCHAPNAGFFNGDFTMTGTAIPASATFDPTAQLQTSGNPYGDSNSYLPVLDANGDPIRNPGYGGGIFASPSNMFQRPLEPYRVKAYKGDLRTAFEGFNKLGQPRTSQFQKDVTVGSTVYTVSLPLQRADALYPPETDDSGNPIGIYYKLGDINPATGIIKSGAVAMTGRDYANYLEGQTVNSSTIDLNLADYGIGVTPKASFTVTDADPVVMGTQVITGQVVGITTAWAQPNSTNTGDVGTVAYSWTTNDSGATIINGNTKTPSITFATVGSKTITLTATNVVTGVSSTASVTVTAETAPISATWLHTANPATGTATFSNLPKTTNTVKVYWGDGTFSTKTGIATGTTTTSLNHAYATTGSKIIQVYCYTSAGAYVGYNQITLAVN